MRLNIFSIAFRLILLLFICEGVLIAQELEGRSNQLRTQGVSYKIDRLWHDILEAIEFNDIRALDELVSDLEEEKVKLGLTSLDDFSLHFLRVAAENYKNKDREQATFFTKKAIQLSPSSPLILLKSLYLVKVTSSGNPFSNLTQALNNIGKFPHLLFSALHTLVYPILFAVTFALYLVLCLLLVSKIQVIRHNIFRKLPYSIAGLTSVILTILLLCQPVFFGPLISLFIWSIIILIFLPSQRAIGLIGGALFLLWATLIPLVENTGLWLKDPRISTMLNVASGGYSVNSKNLLQDLVVSRPKDMVAFFTLGQVLRQQGKLKEAEAIFKRAEVLPGSQPWINAELAVVYFLSNAKDKMKTNLSLAKKNGLNSPEFLYNQSKITFDILDTQNSRDLYKEALKKDPVRVKDLRDREQFFPENHPETFATIKLPFYKIASSALIGLPGTRENSDRLVNSLAPFSNPFTLGGLGLIIFILYFLVNEKNRRRYLISREYSLKSEMGIGVIRCFPGGFLVLQGQLILATAFLSVLFLLLFLWSGWPREAFIIANMIALDKTIYVVLILVLWLFNLLLAFGTKKEGNK